MEIVANILEGKTISLTRIQEDEQKLTLDDIRHLKYAAITSEDVEMSFSTYKNIHSDNSRSLVLEHFKQYIIF